MIITKNLKWKDIYPFAKEINGGSWINNKTGKIVKVLERVGYDLLKIQHSNGRITHKKDHYFIGDYSTYLTDKEIYNECLAAFAESFMKNGDCPRVQIIYNYCSDNDKINIYRSAYKFYYD